MEKGLQRSAVQKGRSISVEDFKSGKLKQGTSLVIHFQDLEEIAKELSMISYTPDISGKLRQIDNDVISAIVPTEQNRNIIRSTLFIETYTQDNNKFYMPNGASKRVKSTLQEYPILQAVLHHDINSF